MSPRLPPHLAWPLKASQIETALGARAEDVRLVRTTWEKKASDTPLSLEWHASRPALQGSVVGEGPTLWMRAVSRDSRSATTELLLRQGLPDLVRWLERAMTATDTWQAVRHERFWRLNGHGLEVAEEAGLVHAFDRERRGHELTWMPLGND